MEIAGPSPSYRGNGRPSLSQTGAVMKYTLLQHPEQSTLCRVTMEEQETHTEGRMRSAGYRRLDAKKRDAANLMLGVSDHGLFSGRLIGEP
jgi:hypothetical protein